MKTIMNVEIADICRTLEEYQLPDKYLVEESSISDGTLLLKYKQARDEYLRRKMMHAVVHQAVNTYDAVTGTFALPQVPTAEEQDALKERRNKVLQTMTEKAADVQRKLIELQAKHSHFQQRRAEFEELVVLHQAGTSDDDDTEENEDHTLDEAELSAQEEKLAALQQRRAALEVQLRSIQQQNTAATKAVEKRKTELNGLVDKENVPDVSTLIQNPVALQNLKLENAKLQSKLEKVKEIHSFYENLRLFMEELTGIRILNVAEGSASNILLVIVQLHHKYDVEIALHVRDMDDMDFTIQSAKFVSNNTVITGPPIDGDEDEDGGMVQLQIPSLDDYVQLAATTEFYGPGENLRFLLRESLARIHVFEERVLELTWLMQEESVVTKMEKLRDEQSFGGHDQEVLCSFVDAFMFAVLRLTPDCPIVLGSVYIDRLEGHGGWDPDVLTKIQAAVQAQKFRSPVAIVHAIKAEIQRLQDEESLTLPLTPEMPVRKHHG